MKNRTTISAHVDQATIERIDQLAKLENRALLIWDMNCFPYNF
jgi:hypothetical protein